MSNPFSTKAVVLGLGINGLALVRSLAIKGIEVDGVYCSNTESARFSRYCRSFCFPDVESDEPAFLARLIGEFGNNDDKPVLLGESDVYVLFISRNRDLLEEHFLFLLPEASLLKKVMHKDTSVAFAAEQGLQTPETYYLNSSISVKDIAAKISYPCLLKPVSCSTEFEAKNIVFKDSVSLEAFLAKHSALLDNFILQAVIPGGDSNIYQSTTYVTTDGTMLPAFTMQKIRQYKPDFGITSFGVSADVPAVVDGTRRFLSNSHYRGFVSIEFKQHPNDGEFYFIELNPRMPMYHSLVLASGINYPFYYYQDMLGIEISRDSVVPQKNGLYWLCFEKDFGSFLLKRSDRKIGFQQWLLSLFRSRVFAYWRMDDQRPFWHALSLFIRQKLRFFITNFWLHTRRTIRKGKAEA